MGQLVEEIDGLLPLGFGDGRVIKSKNGHAILFSSGYYPILHSKKQRGVSEDKHPYFRVDTECGSDSFSNIPYWQRISKLSTVRIHFSCCEEMTMLVWTGRTYRDIQVSEGRM